MEEIDEFDVPIKIKVLDTQTGEIKEAPREDGSMAFGAYWWAEGNGSCDCNRELLFDQDHTGCRSERYLIVKAETDLYDLDELNSSYPKELKDKFLCEPSS